MKKCAYLPSYITGILGIMVALAGDPLWAYLILLTCAGLTYERLSRPEK